ncbi:MAG: hypothetical protein U1E19_09110 [Rhodoblastus sp.]
MATKNGRKDAKSGGQTLLAHLVASGYKRAEPPILQPAAVFLDQLGEDMRGRLSTLTTDAAGAELYACGPSSTLPVSVAYLASSAASKAAAFSYPRLRLSLPARRRQRPNSCRRASKLQPKGQKPPTPKSCRWRWKRRPGRSRRPEGDDRRRRSVRPVPRLAETPGKLTPDPPRPCAWRDGDQIFAAPPANGSDDHSGVLAALEGADKRGARALVEDLLSIAGISSVGGRSVGGSPSSSSNRRACAPAPACRRTSAT